VWGTRILWLLHVQVILPLDLLRNLEDIGCGSGRGET
jgi:hypothetical protein